MNIWKNRDLNILWVLPLSLQSLRTVLILSLEVFFLTNKESKLSAWLESTKILTSKNQVSSV